MQLPHLHMWPLCMDSLYMVMTMLVHMKSTVMADWQSPIGIVPDMSLFVAAQQRMKPVIKCIRKKKKMMSEIGPKTCL